MATATATRTCSAVVGVQAGEWGFDRILCRQSVAVRTYITTGEVRVGFCPKSGHESNVRSRFAEQKDPEWPGDLDYPTTEFVDAMDAAKWAADRNRR